MLIKKTLDLGHRKIWVGLGGSLTVDLGLGALSALGVQFRNAEGETVIPCPGTMSEIVTIDRTGIDPRIAQTELTLLYDVTAPLLGKDGVLTVFGRQKDVSTEQIETWKREFSRLAYLLGADPDVYGSGAAGGLGFALASIGGILKPGAETILDRIGLAYAIRESDFVMTGEGCFDERSIHFEKAPFAAMERFSRADRPGCLFVGRLGLDRDMLLRDHPKLRGIAICTIADEPYDETIRNTFERSVLPMIGKGIALRSDL